jgi:hypothetical protein
MSANIHGILLTNGIYILYGHSAPGTRTDMPELYSAQPSSVYHRTDGTAGSLLYVCTVGGTPASGGSAGVLSTWTAYA